MKVVYVSSYDLPGQRFNGMVIHRSLLAQGHDSDFIVDRKYSSEPRVLAIGPRPLRWLNRVVVRAEKRLSRQADLCVLGLGVLGMRAVRQAQLIHLQLLHARRFFSLRLLPYLASGRRPVLWTIHDPWVTTGHCVHPLDCERWRTGCGACPDLSLPLPITHDRTAGNWELKRGILERSRLHLVVASRWMEQRVAVSPILGHLPRTVIPFGVDPAIFHRGDKAACRNRLAIPTDAKVVSVRWTPHNMLKGTKYVEEALMRLPEGVVTHVICCESSGEDVATLKSRYTVISLPWLERGADVATALAASDVFLMPSIGETFGMMAIEAMACGVPVIAFDGTSLPEVIDAPACGMTVPRGSAEALGAAITKVMTEQGLRQQLSANALARVARDFTEAAYVARHITLYERLIDGHRRTS